MDYLAGRPEFVARVRAATVKAAVAVGAEADDGTEHRRLRRALSVNVLQEPESWSSRFARAVATSAAIEIDSLDSEIEFSVNSVWNSVAGAGAEPAPAA
ncbi:hypothetical protein [Longimycelium tulufanense]|nr:hypothetical protein [Longimycelium tulufanense]